MELATENLSKLNVNGDFASSVPNLHKNLQLLSPQQVRIRFCGIVIFRRQILLEFRIQLDLIEAEWNFLDLDIDIRSLFIFINTIKLYVRFFKTMRDSEKAMFLKANMSWFCIFIFACVFFLNVLR